MTTTTYLVRRQARLSLDALKRDIVFGYVVSCILLALGLWKYFIVVGASDSLALLMAGCGACGMLLTLIFPSAWSLPQSGAAALMRHVGGFLFAVLLAFVYAVLVTPFGILLRALKGRAPIYQWADHPPEGMEGWHPKVVLCETNHGGNRRAGVARRFVHIIAFFIDRGHYLFLPMLVILIALGLVLFFVKTSALAPLIYTLF